MFIGSINSLFPKYPYLFKSENLEQKLPQVVITCFMGSAFCDLRRIGANSYHRPAMMAQCTKEKLAFVVPINFMPPVDLQGD